MRTLTYQNGVLVSDEDSRTVSTSLTAQLAEIDRWKSARLAETDWAIIRAQDPTGKPVPQDILDQRTAIRSAGETAEAALRTAAATATDDQDKTACDAIEAVIWGDTP